MRVELGRRITMHVRSQRLHAESPERVVAVRGDQRVAYGEVVKVLDACRTAGYSDVRLMSQQRDPHL
jgi:biopolymer transport protein ExbD